MGLSVKVPMLEAEGCVTESETGFTDTAEPAAAVERRESTTDFPAHWLYMDIIQCIELITKHKELKQDIYLLLIVLLALN